MNEACINSLKTHYPGMDHGTINLRSMFFQLNERIVSDSDLRHCNAKAGIYSKGKGCDRKITASGCSRLMIISNEHRGNLRIDQILSGYQTKMPKRGELGIISAE